MPKTWPACDVCGQPVTTTNGYLTIDKVEFDTAEERIDEWDAKHANEFGGISVDMTELLDRPDVAHWQWGHGNCLPEGMYNIDARRFNTIGKALDWTLHMIETKNWLEYTDWTHAVRRLHVIPNA